jgi:hypothetical protein
MQCQITSQSRSRSRSVSCDSSIIMKIIVLNLSHGCPYFGGAISMCNEPSLSQFEWDSGRSEMHGSMCWKEIQDC